MKANIHPKWYPEAVVKCACGNVFTVGAPYPEIEVEICSMCHPFYTGQMKYVDTAGRVDAFKSKQSRADINNLSKAKRRAIKRAKRISEEMERPESLSELRSSKSKILSKKKKSKKN